MGTGQKCANDTDLLLADCKTSAIMDIMLQAFGHSTDHENGMFSDSQKLAGTPQDSITHNKYLSYNYGKIFLCYATSSRWITKSHE